MHIKVQKTDLKEILPFREMFLKENNFQIRYNACHERNWSDSYLLIIDEVPIGYGSVKGKDNHADRDTVFEFYAVPRVRNLAPSLFKELLKPSSAICIECQSNELTLTSLLYEFSHNINADVILFEDHNNTELAMRDVLFRKRIESDAIFEHTSEPVGDYVLEQRGEVVATGGFMLHYNIPFADLYMEVKPTYRRSGLGSFLIQELGKQCRASGRIPAARCNLDNIASRYALLKGGLKICGYMLAGTIKNSVKY